MKARLLIGFIVGLGLLISWQQGAWLYVVVAVFVAVALVADGVFRPASQLFGRVRYRAEDEGRVAITFDDGPDPEVTPQLLSVLAAHDAKATFFVIAREAAEQPELMRMMSAAGHEVANHSYDHDRYLNFKSKSTHRSQLERAQDVLTSLVAPPRWYRPPMGLKSPPLLDALAETSLELVTWSIRSGDTRRGEKDVRRRLSKISGGDIVVLHDGHDLKTQKRDVSLRVLPWLLQLLEQRGLRAVTVSELLDGPTP